MKSDLPFIHLPFFLRQRDKNICFNEMSLGRKDSNLRVTGPKPAALPLGHAPFPSDAPHSYMMLVNTNIQYFVNLLKSQSVWIK